MNRPWRVVQPDNTAVTNQYTLKGEPQKTYGSRIYPMEYTYDSQGREKTMNTWQNFNANNGVATTTWNYDQYRGLLNSKPYKDNTGPGYTYTAAGRLQTRTWARGITTTYGYGTAGDPAIRDFLRWHSGHYEQL